MTSRWDELYDQGKALTADQVEVLERRLAANPTNTAVRVMLLGYLGASVRPPEGLPARRSRVGEHWLWIAEHAPWLPLAFHLPFLPMLGEDAQRARMRELWRAAVRAHPDDAWTLRNAVAAGGDDDYLDEVLGVAKRWLRDRPAQYPFFLQVLTWGTITRHVRAARQILEIMLDACVAESDRARRYHLIWNMRDLAKQIGREDVLDRLRRADAAGKRWRQATAAGQEPEATNAAREADTLVAEARAQLK
jgi:hypothetical protein